MKNFVFKRKMSKKERKELNQQQRKGWDGFSCLTRIKPNKKKYNRKIKNKYE